MFEYTTDTYWALEAYHLGRLSVFEDIIHPNLQTFKKIGAADSKKSILKYRTMALISQDREAIGRGKKEK